MAERIKAWWWIIRHPIKATAIRRYLRDSEGRTDG